MTEVYKNRCKICGGPFESKRKDAQYCGDKCRQESVRKGKNVTDNVTDNQERLMEDLEKKTVKELDAQRYWVPNWKRAGTQTRKDAFYELMRVCNLIPGLYKFMGYKINTYANDTN